MSHEGERYALVTRVENARTTINRGIVVLALIPFVISGSVLISVAIGSMVALSLAVIIAALYAVGGGLAGISMLASGTVEHRRATRLLRSLDERHQLPAARIVMRGEGVRA